MWRRSLLVAVLVTVNCFSSCIASAWDRGLHADSQNAISMEHKSKAVWKAQWHHLAGVSVSNQRLVHLLGPLLQYDYTLPKSQVRRGLTYFGSGHRLRRAVRKLLTGTKPMKIGLVGGSISWGEGASKRGVTDWFSVFSRWAISAFPQTNVTLRNGCVPGTPSSYMVMCLELSVDPDVDIVFVEFVLNDGCCDAASGSDSIMNNRKVKTYERLIRRILALPNKPAVVLMQVTTHGMAQHPGTPGWRPFHSTLEDVYSGVAEYYGASVLSFRTSLYRLATHRNESGYKWNEVMSDWHPGDKGFKCMSDLAVWLFQSTALDLMLHPYGDEDREQMYEPLPAPMYPGNLPPNRSMCLYQDTLQSVVVSQEGWNYTNEGTEAKPKKGYVTWEVGKRITFLVDTTRPHDPEGADALVPVFLAYMRSYTNMGKAAYACVSGCTCEPKTYDAHHTEKVTQLYLAELHASQHLNCTITVTVLPETSSGKTKYKVAGLMLSEVTKNNPGMYNDVKEGHWGATYAVRPELQMQYVKNASTEVVGVDPNTA